MGESQKPPGRLRPIPVLLALVLPVASAYANSICGDPPRLSRREASQVRRAVFGLGLSSAAGETFAWHAARVHGELVKGRSRDDARRLAVALLHGHCLAMTRNQDPSSLSWHVRDHIIGLSKLVPDFREAQAIIDRLQAAQTRR
jgi:hypothetical protein